MSGTVNSLRAVLEHQRRIFTEAGVSFGEECTGEGECRDLTFEDLLAQEADELAYYDDNPSAIDVWVDGDSHIERMEIRVEPSPADDPGDGVTVMVEYSEFNAVVVEAPE